MAFLGRNDFVLWSAPAWLTSFRSSARTIAGTIPAHPLVGVCFGGGNAGRNIREGTRDAGSVGLSPKNPAQFSSDLPYRWRRCARRSSRPDFDGSSGVEHDRLHG